MLASLFGWNEPTTRRARKRARQSASSSLTRLCFEEVNEQCESSPPNKNFKEIDTMCISIDQSSRGANRLPETKLTGVTGDVFIIPVWPSKSREFAIEFYVRRGTTDEQVIDEVIKRNVYQQRCLKRCLSDNSAQVWLDIGANIGTFSVLAAMQDCRVYAIEPERENCIMARANAALNDLEGRITIYEQAVVPPTHPNKRVDLHLCNGKRNKYRHTTVETYPGGVRRSLKVHCSQLEDIISTIPQPIHGIKMDIEGSEIGILENLRAIPSTLKYLVFEYSFDFSRSVGRFNTIISRLRSWFHVEHAKVVGDGQGNYSFYPPSCLVYCVRLEKRSRKQIMTFIEQEADIYKRLSRELMEVKLPKRKRNGVYSGTQRSVTFGWVFNWYKGGKRLATCNEKFPLVYALLKEIIKFSDISFQFTSIQVNQNVNCKPHIDKNNVGETVIIGFGDYSEGNIVVERKVKLIRNRRTSYNISGNFLRFNASNFHWTEPWIGNRITVMFYSNRYLIGLELP